ncbi:hypothetical protein B0H13DRAFT_1879856 [Mycena leptocephala]|nr:hypothetical protein B0H13DRAFT_1879856 [Mycena leptocephala]
MARTRTKKNSLPPPARLLGNELGKHPAQLPPQLLAPQKITGPRMLLVSWNAVSLAPNRAASTLIAPRKDGADPLQIFLPRPKDGWIRLSDHRNALETIHLHPKMQLNRYLRKSRAKHAQWSSFGWGTVINVGAKETLLMWKPSNIFEYPEICALRIRREREREKKESSLALLCIDDATRCESSS